MKEEKTLRNLNSAFAGLLILICFLPMFGLNAYEMGYSNTLGITGFGALVGMTFTDGTEMGMNISAAFLFLFPLALILSNQVEAFKAWKQYYIFIAPYGCMIGLFVTKILIDHQMNASVSADVGFWIYLLFSLITLMVGYWQSKDTGVRQQYKNEFAEPKFDKLQIAPLAPVQQGAKCPACGAPVGKGKKFCAACGAKIMNEERRCAQCNSIIPEDANFCMECGAKYADKPDIQERTCPKCGHKMAQNEKFCMECGTAISEEESASK